ncbi:ABC-F family ATP-binding cassette domain-containing protein [Nonomuraea sp. KC401]|uniref:ABC-F family ATP-binding cassette domain-containing protein n=1 Tax=unclassified Nonomuraea TaxID=2593643 RepID=UPI0010FDC4D6|nr:MULTISPECIES: ABC-F family ATP-binding cassette domain-containing protein [unclassified Nonomuraea]NBE99984.1 ATP-binding cassette domain-containing protein [Nonomuraea sp. K271]TLF56621.1 ABC-F family ATP-binding cassette domain-containing protein [Nonomuraea sp. KC401]
MSFSLVIDHVSFAWPDGSKVLDRLDAAFPAGRTGLIGLNGSGKSTLIKIIAGELAPQSGSVSVAGEVGYLPQNVPLAAGRTVSDLLEISATRTALHAIEGGDVAEEHFAAVGDDWDVEERARAELDRLGLGHIGLDRTVGTLSGGETVMVALAAQLLKRPDVLLLDEPTNNLDLEARRRLYAAVSAWQGVLLLVSHDRALLELVDQVAELRDGAVRMYGGNLSAYEEQVDAEQEAAERTVRTAEGEVRRQQRELVEARTRIDRGLRAGRKAFENKKVPKIVANGLKRKAQVSAGKQRTLHLEKLEEARERLTEAEQSVRDDAEIRIELPGTEVPAGRTVLTLPLDPPPGAAPPAQEDAQEDAQEGAEEIRRAVLETLVVRGPERIALLGRNGSGKTTLLRRILEHGAHVPVHYLPQRLDLLDDALSVVDNVRAAAPSASVNEVRARLARFLFRGERANQAAGTLSGGERFRATLAALLSAEPPPQLLLLDEPTNNLDMASAAQLAQALSAYRGALIVASHDVPFLETLGITRWLHQDREAGLAET